MAVSPRERLIETATQLFYRHGYHATGIDRILAESGVAKKTLYTHFRSKDELILAALRRRDERFRNSAMRELAARTDDPAERLVLLFDILDAWFTEPDFSGCMFINAAAEYAAADEPIHAAAAEHKRLFAAYLRSQATAAGARDPDELTDQLVLLMEGAITTAHVSGPGRVAARAREVAELLVRQATTPGATRAVP
jgi:AcrR family transcriptional regulator